MSSGAICGQSRHGAAWYAAAATAGFPLQKSLDLLIVVQRVAPVLVLQPGSILEGGRSTESESAVKDMQSKSGKMRSSGSRKRMVAESGIQFVLVTAGVFLLLGSDHGPSHRQHQQHLKSSTPHLPPPSTPS